MKRLRAPEQSDTRATSPAASAPADSAAPQAASDSSAPSSATASREAPAAELPAGVEMGQSAPKAEADVPQQPSPALQEAEPTSRCNGETLTSLDATAEAKDEQG